MQPLVELCSRQCCSVVTTSWRESTPMPSTRKIRKPQEDAWLSVRAASQILGESRFTILARAIRGELEAQYIAGRTVISRASVERALGDSEAAK